MTWLLLALAGGIGALARAEVSTRLPDGRGTAAVNVSGAALLGIVVALAASGTLGQGTVRIVGTGLLGGFTTFSTWMVEGVHAGPARGGVLVGGQLVVGVAAAALTRVLVG